jgi:hypothetical protein
MPTRRQFIDKNRRELQKWESRWDTENKKKSVKEEGKVKKKPMKVKRK